MLTLRRFKELAGAYGADLERWPVDRQTEAQALLQSSAEARAVLEDAASLDQMLAIGRLQADADAWRGTDLDIALARVRAGVSGEIAAQHRVSVGRAESWFDTLAAIWLVYRRPLSLSAFGAAAIVAGIWLGSESATALSQHGGSNAVMALLQPEPVHMLSV